MGDPSGQEPQIAMEFASGAIGITSTIPIEIPLAAKRQIIDLNNRFILHPRPSTLIKIAESEGFPRNCCSWIKGIFGLVRSLDIRRIIFVTGGDCSNTHALMETLLPQLTDVFTFSYPYPASSELLEKELIRFSTLFQTTLSEAEAVSRFLIPVRKDLAELDALTWQGNRVTGEENHLWLVSSSDFDGDVAKFHCRLRSFLDEARARPPLPEGPRLGVVGVPPIFSDLHKVIESLGARIVFNEIPCQFAMLRENETLAEKYSAFTYPYGVWARAGDISRQAERRGLHGIIHYTQSFCHRQIHDIIIRREIGLPTLTLEGEMPGAIDQRTRLRIEGYLEILMEKMKKGQTSP